MLSITISTLIQPCPHGNSLLGPWLDNDFTIFEYEVQPAAGNQQCTNKLLNLVPYYEIITKMWTLKSSQTLWIRIRIQKLWSANDQRLMLESGQPCNRSQTLGTRLKLSITMNLRKRNCWKCPFAGQYLFVYLMDTSGVRQEVCVFVSVLWVDHSSWFEQCPKE